MKLTYDLKCKYVRRANEEFKQMTGLPSSPFFAGAKATDEIHSDVKLWEENTQNEHINMDSHETGISRYEIHCLKDEQWPVYWSGSIHVNHTSFWTTHAYVKEEIWKKLFEIANNPEVIPAVKDWNELSRARRAKVDKRASSREKKIEIAEMDIDGSLTQQQIQDQYPGYYVVFLRTKIVFHRIIGKYLDGSPIWRKESEWSINIRPANKDLQDYYDHKCLYNKKKFEELMSKWSKYNAFIEEN